MGFGCKGRLDALQFASARNHHATAFVTIDAKLQPLGDLLEIVLLDDWLD